MSHVFPLAANAEAALDPQAPAVRTRHEADALAERLGVVVGALETEWLEVSDEEAGHILSRADAALGQGFVQRYEDETGRPVLAVTYWQVSHKARPGEDAGADREARPRKPGEDHTDDLYFRGGRTRRRKRRPRVDPRQLDLFAGPDQQGYEDRDPNNPDIALNHEEGDSTVFGGG
jgi:hypothetical protein